MKLPDLLLSELIRLERAVIQFRINHNYWDEVEYEGDYHKLGFYLPLVIEAAGELKKSHTFDIIRYVFERHRNSFNERDFERNKSGNYRFNNMIYSSINKLRKNNIIKSLKIRNGKSEIVELTKEGLLVFYKIRAQKISSDLLK